jgi:hypothetical protein
MIKSKEKTCSFAALAVAALGIEAEFFAERGNTVAVSGAKNWSG